MQNHIESKAQLKINEKEVNFLDKFIERVKVSKSNVMLCKRRHYNR